MAGEVASSTEGPKEMKEACRPIKADVWDIAEEKRVDVLRGWELPRFPEYRGMHGMGIPNEEAQGMLWAWELNFLDRTGDS